MEIISETELQHLSLPELQAKYYELFNELARRKQAVQEFANILNSMNRIDMLLHTIKLNR